MLACSGGRVWGIRALLCGGKLRYHRSASCGGGCLQESPTAPIPTRHGKPFFLRHSSNPPSPPSFTSADFLYFVYSLIVSVVKLCPSHSSLNLNMRPF